MAAPPVPTPADYFALTRILLVPSVWDEPFGRVAAEAMINGDPAARQQPRLAAARRRRRFRQRRRRSRAADPRVDDRTRRRGFPSEQEVEPWYEAVCALWDDRALYQAMAARARQIADERYSEDALAQAACGLLHLADAGTVSDRRNIVNGETSSEPCGKHNASTCPGAGVIPTPYWSSS